VSIRKQMSKQTTREHLIQVGLGMVRSAGYLATGVNQVLEAAKIPKGSFYHHFATKDEFILEVIKRYAAGEQQRWERLLGHSNLSPLKKLRRYFKNLIATYGVRGGPVAGCLLGNMSIEIAAQNPEIERRWPKPLRLGRMPSRWRFERPSRRGNFALPKIHKDLLLCWSMVGKGAGAV